MATLRAQVLRRTDGVVDVSLNSLEIETELSLDAHANNVFTGILLSPIYSIDSSGRCVRLLVVYPFQTRLKPGSANSQHNVNLWGLVEVFMDLFVHVSLGRRVAWLNSFAPGSLSVVC